ncbi:MAG: hypothetical protein R3222_01875, partial [Balneolaceae bacterium]|nr:hypothetical protein [Balneolaceae bacterium]
MNNHFYPVILLLSIIIWSGCSTSNRAEPETTIEGRWFTRQQFETGKVIFAENCARCHGEYGQSIV